MIDEEKRNLDVESEDSNDITSFSFKLKFLKRCERCWRVREDVGRYPIPDLCERCYEIAKE